MKKEYSKPGLFIEEFSLVENISLTDGCTMRANHYKSACPYDGSGNVTDQDKEIFEGFDFTHMFYSEDVCAGGVVGGDNMMDCLNGFAAVFAS